MEIAVFPALSRGKLSINSPMVGQQEEMCGGHVDALGVRLSNRSASAATEGELQSSNVFSGHLSSAARCLQFQPRSCCTNNSISSSSTTTAATSAKN